jgi:hypothetical protein
MLTQLTGQNLPQWISDARAAELPGISSFAKGLEQDLDAVTQGLTSRWNSGPVEGRVNHIKMINRGAGRHGVRNRGWRGGDQRVPVMTDQQEPFGLVALVPIAWRTLDACPAHRTS